MTQFYDSDAAEFPEGADLVCVYADGPHKAPADIYQRYPQAHSITVTGTSWQPGILDYEQFEPDYPGGVRSWVEKRLARRMRAIVYSDRDNLHLLATQLGPVLFADPLVQFWIATLDPSFTAATLSASISRQWGVWIPASRIWGNQVVWGTSWDTSDLYGSWD